MPRRLTQKEFVDKLQNVSPCIEVLGQYEGTMKPIEVRCLTCGNVWNPTPNGLLNGSGCPACGKRMRAEVRRRSGDTKKRNGKKRFEREMAKRPDVVLLSNYIDSKTKVSCRCTRCGREWQTTPASLLQGHGCHSCAHARNHMKTQGEFVLEMSSINPDIEIMGEYQGVGKRVNCRCRRCGHEWAPTAGSILSGRGCPRCKATNARDRLLKGHEEFVSNLNAVNPDIEVIGRYKSSKEPIQVRCRICGTEWSPTPNTLLHAEGCPVCYHGSTSVMEQTIGLAFERALGNGAVRSRDRSAIGEELDIFIPSLSLALEPGSWFWHKDKLDSDARKRGRCAERGIRLITIYDAAPKGTEPPFGSDCFVFEVDLGTQLGSKTLRALVGTLLKQCGLSLDLNDNMWATLRSQAKRASRRMTTEEFAERLARINDQVIVLGSYLGSATKIEVQCKRCGHEWKATPNNLMHGYGCPKCKAINAGDCRRKSPEQFVREVTGANPDIEILGTYTSSKEHIRTRCKKCGYVWEPQAGHLLNGHGCPICAHRALSSTKTKTQERFLVEMADVNPNVEVVGTYRGVAKKVLCRCRKCGHEWEARPGDLLNGHGCPKCARKR